MHIKVYLSYKYLFDLEKESKMIGTAAGVRSFGKALESMIPSSFRTKMMVFWRVSRCDIQSTCAEQARILIKLIVSDIEKFYNSNKDQCKGAVFQGKIPIISKECRDLIKALLDRCGESETTQDNFLTLHNCNALALLTIEEALMQVETGMASAHEISMKEKVMKVLEGLQINLRDNYSPTIGIPIIAAKLDLKKLQYTGKGMEYLKLLSKNNSELKSNSYAINSSLSSSSSSFLKQREFEVGETYYT